MYRRRVLLSFVLFGLTTALSAQSGGFNNPVINADFPDPTVIRGQDGKYYTYATQGGGANIQVAVSDDLRSWTVAGDALPVPPRWADHHFWAPHVLYDSTLKQYVMFYSGESVDTTVGKCMGVAFADQPFGPFTDMGEPLICGGGFVNIDPMAMVDAASGKKLLYWGSGFEPLKVQEMSDNWRSFRKGSKPLNLVAPGKEKKYTRLLEGAWVTFHDGFYYLFYSGDNCCGEGASYAVMVARSKKATGPFITMAEATGKQNSVVLEKDSVWNAPGHNSVIADKSGKYLIVYHAIAGAQAPAGSSKNGRLMCIRPLRFENGWPVVE